jgi:NTP pyrophosphatase (non-canonical NTP hydrolase)
MDTRFLQEGFDLQLSHVIEECGEVVAAAGKTQRWGRNSMNPLLLSPLGKETNQEWLERELKDLRHAIDRLENTILLEKRRG